MKNHLIINSKGKVGKKPTVRPSLPYHAIARRAIQDSHIAYDREIDISAVLIK
jgi:hypothetical protein